MKKNDRLLLIYFILFSFSVSVNADNDVTSDDGETSLEAELDSLPVSEGQTVENNDNAEEELEQIGKLLRNSSQKLGTILHGNNLFNILG